MGLQVKGSIVIVFMLLFRFQFVFSQTGQPDPVAESWADSILIGLSQEEKIGQLIMVAAYSNKQGSYYQNLQNLIERYHIGGLIFFQGSPQMQYDLTRRFQEVARVPLFIAMDAEWGAAMRLDSLESLPRQMTLGAIRDNRIIYNYGAEIARQCRLLGVHINFAPVLDVNNNAANPVINVRSFGENPQQVAEKGIACIRGLQDNGIMAAGKHFPGHGDTRTDSHYALPLIGHPRERLDSIEMVPFKKAIAEGLEGMMVAHLNIPALEARQGWSASLSKNIVTGTLKEEMGFRGITFTDALNMRGVTSVIPAGKLEVEAFKAGNDILVMPVNTGKTITELNKALDDGRISGDELDGRVKKILYRKYQAGLNETEKRSAGDLTRRINGPVPALNQEIFEHAITLVKNEDNLIPFHLIDTTRFASLAVNAGQPLDFQSMLDQYTSVDHFAVTDDQAPNLDYERLLNRLAAYEVVIISLHKVSGNRGQYAVSKKTIDFIRALDQSTQVVLVVFGIPYTLDLFSGIRHLLCGYEDTPYSRQVVPQILFGALPARGRLPVTVSPQLREGAGVDTRMLGRLSFRYPERLGLTDPYCEAIDNIVQEAIEEKAMPGCQVLIARKGSVIFNKQYGYQTYDSLKAITDHSMYDLASVTKVAGTIQALMMLYDKGLVDLDKKISRYLPELINTNKEDLIIRDILTHQSGLFPYLPFWKKTIFPAGNYKKYYRRQPSGEYSIEVTPGFFTKPALRDSLWSWIIQSDLIEKEDPEKPYEYKYSDMGFYVIQRLIEEITAMPLDRFLEEFIFEPLGLRAFSFLPRKKFPVDLLVPSEVDGHFRKDLIQGNVHDEIASIYGGVAGHAGLFSNAYELSKILQMNLQDGYYGGIRYFQPNTLNEFTRRQYKNNRRGLGWDKPMIIGDDYNPASFFASQKSYGHSGFTGTYAWVDPEYDLIYIFLSNRSYPDAENRKLIDQDVRKRIQTVIYSSILNKE